MGMMWQLNLATRVEQASSFFSFWASYSNGNNPYCLTSNTSYHAITTISNQNAGKSLWSSVYHLTFPSRTAFSGYVLVFSMTLLQLFKGWIVLFMGWFCSLRLQWFIHGIALSKLWISWGLTLHSSLWCVRDVLNCIPLVSRNFVAWPLA